MNPTRPPLLITLLVVGAAVGWGISIIASGWTGRSLPVPVLAGSALWLLAIALIVWGSIIRPRLQANVDPTRHPGIEPLPVLVAARIAAIAMAASRMGVAVAGVYVGVTIATISSGLSTPAAQRSLLSALLAASGSAVVAGAGLRLERWCLLPSSNDDADQ